MLTCPRDFSALSSPSSASFQSTPVLRCVQCSVTATADDTPDLPAIFTAPCRPPPASFSACILRVRVPARPAETRPGCWPPAAGGWQRQRPLLLTPPAPALSRQVSACKSGRNWSTKPLRKSLSPFARRAQGAPRAGRTCGAATWKGPENAQLLCVSVCTCEWHAGMWGVCTLSYPAQGVCVRFRVVALGASVVH